MKKLLSLALVLFSFVAVAHAIDGEAQDCSTDAAGREAFVEANNEKIDTGQPACGCISVKETEGEGDDAREVTNSYDSDGNKVKYCVELQEPIAGVRAITGEDGVGLFSSYIRQLYVYGASIIGIICVVVIVVSGIQISMGGANSEFVNQGKERILQALFSMILLFSSALILQTVNPGFFETGDRAPAEVFEFEESCEEGSTIEDGQYNEDGDLVSGSRTFVNGQVDQGTFNDVGDGLTGTRTYPSGAAIKYKDGECDGAAECAKEDDYFDSDDYARDYSESTVEEDGTIVVSGNKNVCQRGR